MSSDAKTNSRQDNRKILKNLHDHAYLAASLGNFETALTSYEEILRVNPEDPSALHFIAFLQNLQGNHRCAIDLMKKVIKINSCNGSYYSTLAEALKNTEEFTEAFEAVKTAVRLKPDAINFSNAASILFSLRKLSKAKELYQYALTLDDSPFIHFNYSLFLLSTGEYEEGFKEYDWRLPFQFDQPIPEYPESLKGKKICVKHEQGYGDFLMCARYFPLIKEAGAEFYVDCPRALASLFDPHYCPDPDHTFMAMSLPRLFKGLIPEKPYIFAEPIRKGGIGVAFAAKKPFNNSVRTLTKEDGSLCFLPHPANLAYLSASKRSLPHDFFDPFPGELFNLQNDTDHNLMHNVKAKDFKELAGWVAGMDLIITIDTALVHLAGAMGKKTFLLLPYDCDWRWGLTGEQTVWYPSVKIFRQHKRGSWGQVQDAVLKELAVS